jgi:hypothetical protein
MTPSVQPLTRQSTVSGAVGAGQPAANRENVDGGIAGATMSWQRGGAVLACWRDDKSAAGWTTVLAHWRDDESAAGRTVVLACLCVGDASSKCKEAGGAQDRIIHDGNDDEDGGSCCGPCSRMPWKGWGREGTASPILCPTTASTTTMDCSSPVQGTQQRGDICSSWRGG